MDRPQRRRLTAAPPQPGPVAAAPSLPVSAGLPTHQLSVLVDLPQHAALDSVLNYEHTSALPPGTWVRVPLGRRSVLGLVWDPPVAGEGMAPNAMAASAKRPQPTIKAILEVLDGIDPLSLAWRSLVKFAASYYQRSLGEVALLAMPPALRQLDGAAWQRRLRRWALSGATGQGPPAGLGPAMPAQREGLPELTPGQAEVLKSLDQWGGLGAGSAPVCLLHGVTGSGKTEVYLRAADQAIAQGAQVLVLVPEINLTPQLLSRFEQRLVGRRVVAMHSALTPAQRLESWARAQTGSADVVLGTRLAIWTPLARLGLIIVDEEHDPSFKQQDGARYSARDLAVMRGRLVGCLVVLGSATPSLESWHNAQLGRYRLLSMPHRVGDARLPKVRRYDLSREPPPAPGVAPLPLARPLLAALQQRIDAGEQSLVLLNRRGYAPVLHCGDCGWKSACSHCSAWRVFHKLDRTLRCHHCGQTDAVPRACPDCGNLDIAPIGRGTQRLEEQLLASLKGRQGGPVRMVRIDADSTRGPGALQAQLAAVHDGDVDVVVGTQMVTKGHDFRRMTLVAAINTDAALFAADFRAAERLFAMLMQAGGRAGRDAQQTGESELWVQTHHPEHPLLRALAAHDYVRFAEAQLTERRTAGLPPFSHLALLRAEARHMVDAVAFLQAAAAELTSDTGPAAEAARGVQVYPPVPLTVAKVADVERAQLLLESTSRATLQTTLAACLPAWHALKAQHRRVLRWAVDVDPLSL